MLRLVPQILAPLLAILILMFGQGYFMSFVSLRLAEDGLSDWIIGIVHAAFYGGMLIGAWRAEDAIRGVGHIRTFATYAAINTACLMIQGLHPSLPWLWVATRFVMGYSLAMFYVVIESWFLVKSTESTRGTILALYMIGLYGSQAFSQFLLKFIDTSGPEAFMYAGLFCALSAVPLTLTRSPTPDLPEHTTYTYAKLMRRSPFGFSGCIIAGIVLSSIYSFTPLFAERNDLSVAWVMSLCILGGVVLQWPLGKLSDVMDRRLVLLAVTVVATAQSLLVLMLNDSVSANTLLVMIFLLGGSCFTVYPLAITQVCDRLNTEELTKATGVLLLVYGLGAVIGPLLAPLCLSEEHPGGLFLFLALVLGLLSLIGLQALFRAPSVPSDDQGDFVPLPMATPLAYELDPRLPGDDELDD